MPFLILIFAGGLGGGSPQQGGSGEREPPSKRHGASGAAAPPPQREGEVQYMFSRPKARYVKVGPRCAVVGDVSAELSRNLNVLDRGRNIQKPV